MPFWLRRFSTLALFEFTIWNKNNDPIGDSDLSSNKISPTESDGISIIQWDKSYRKWQMLSSNNTCAAESDSSCVIQQQTCVAESDSHLSSNKISPTESDNDPIIQWDTILQKVTLSYHPTIRVTHRKWWLWIGKFVQIVCEITRKTPRIMIDIVILDDNFRQLWKKLNNFRQRQLKHFQIILNNAQIFTQSTFPKNQRKCVCISWTNLGLSR